MADGWVQLSAIGTGLSAAFVAWQAWETRRATNTSRNSLQAAWAMVADEARDRMDEQAPKTEAYLDGNLPWPPLVPSTVGGTPQPEVLGKMWHFPKDEDQRLQLYVHVYVENLSDRKVYVEFGGEVRDGRDQTPMLLLAHCNLPLTLLADFTVREWAANRAAHQTGQPLPTHADGYVTVAGDQDRGVVDTWRVSLTGCPVQPVPDRDALWQLTGKDDKPVWIQYEMRPLRERAYWVSRKAGTQMPQPVYNTPRRRRGSLRRPPGAA